MIGAIIGDIAGSTFEMKNAKSKDIPIYAPKSGYTDDSLMTIAVAQALHSAERQNILEDEKLMHAMFAKSMVFIAREYPCQRGGYGGSFSAWLNRSIQMPYNSYGNGSAMRVSPCAYVGKDLKEVLKLAKWSAEVSHDHPEGIKGAQTIAAAIYLAREGRDKNYIRQFINEHFYNLYFTLDDIRPIYKFDVTCQGSVPQAIEAFLESTSFEDAIKNAISIGGDSDTIAAMAGSIAWPFYKKNGGVTDGMYYLWKVARFLLGEELETIAVDFEKRFDS